MIQAHCLKGSFIMCSDQHMEIFEASKGLVLCLKEVNSFVAHVIIYNYEVVEMTLDRAGIHRVGQVHLDEVKWSSSAVS